MLNKKAFHGRTQYQNLEEYRRATQSEYATRRYSRDLVSLAVWESPDIFVRAILRDSYRWRERWALTVLRS